MQALDIVSKISGIEGWLSDEVAELLITAAEKTPDHGCIVEIGSWKGKSTLCFALSNHHKKIIAIDPFEGSQEHKHLQGQSVNTYQEFIENLAKFGVSDRVSIYKMTSEQASKEVDLPISVLWIDGSHDYEDVKNDFQLWIDRVVPGGVILFHDSKWEGVRKVLWEDFFTYPRLGPIQRVEDTTFAFKTKTSVLACSQYNSDLLELEKDKQKLKRLHRKLRKLAPNKIKI